MSISTSSKICLVFPKSSEGELVLKFLSEIQFRNVTHFTSFDSAYESALRIQYDVFVTTADSKDQSGLVLIQKLRSSGNYGFEGHLIVVDELRGEYLNLLHELDITNILKKPLNKASFLSKFTSLVKAENYISEFDKTFRLARSALICKNMDMAHHYAERLYKLDSKAEKTLILLGDINCAEKNESLMLRFFEAALVEHPKSPVVLYKMAMIEIQRGDFSKAALLLDKLALSNPYHISILENAGLSHFEIKNYQIAMEYGERLHSLDKTNKNAFEIKAKVQIHQGRVAEAGQTLLSSHNEADIVKILNNAGAKLSAENDIEGALAIYLECLSLVKDDKYRYAIHFNIGLAYKKLKKPVEALDHFRFSQSYNPSFEKSAKQIRATHDELLESLHADVKNKAAI